MRQSSYICVSFCLHVQHSIPFKESLLQYYYVQFVFRAVRHEFFYFIFLRSSMSPVYWASFIAYKIHVRKQTSIFFTAKLNPIPCDF
jgi:hypothetical protein